MLDRKLLKNEPKELVGNWSMLADIDFRSHTNCKTSLFKRDDNAKTFCAKLARR